MLVTTSLAPMEALWLKKENDMVDFNGRARAVLAPTQSVRPQARPDQTQDALAPTESILPQARPEQTQGSQTVVDKEREDLFALFTQMLTEYKNATSSPALQPVSESLGSQFDQSSATEMGVLSGGVAQASGNQIEMPEVTPVTAQTVTPKVTSTEGTTEPNLVSTTDQRAAPTAAEPNGPIAQKLGIDFAQIEVDNGLPAGFLERSAMIESSGNPNAKNPTSSAGGLFQQIDSNAKAFGVENRFDPVQSTDGAVKFAKQNQGILREALGREPTAAELYLAHQQGAGGAKSLLTRSSEPALTVLKSIYNNEATAKKALVNNGGTQAMTAGDFANIWIKKFNQGGGGQNTQTTPPSRSARPKARPESTTQGDG